MKFFNEVIEELISSTYNKNILWKNENPQSWDTVIFNYNFTYKAYSADFTKNGITFKLLFVEKKFPDQHSDWAGIAETYFPELIILNESRMPLGVINESNAAKDDLIRLSGAIESNNEGMNRFMNLFK